MKVAAVIFDMDGLLLDTERAAVSAWLEAAESMGLSLTRETALATIGVDWDNTMRIIQRALHEDTPNLELRRRMDGLRRRQCEEQGVPVKPGAAELLSRLKDAGIPAGLATSTARESAEWLLGSAGLLRFLSAGAFGSEVRQGKPAPDIYLLAAERLGVKPERCAAVEDSPTGVKAAKAAGMTTILVPDLIAPDASALAHADFVAQDLYGASRYLFGD